jgi:hypothetical protein
MSGSKVWTDRAGLAGLAGLGLRRPLVLGLATLAIGLGSACSSTSTGSDGGGGHAGSGAGTGGTAGTVGGGTGGSGNPGTDAGVLSCGLSVAQACETDANDNCELTWSAVQTDTVLCNNVSLYVYSREFDCFGYHVLEQVNTDSGASSYYDSASGALVAIVGNNNGTISCYVGPAGGFTPPSGCSNANSPPPQCIVDSGNERGPRD